MANTAEEKEERKVNKFQWFVFTGLIPTLFAVLIILIVLSFAGVNVFEKAKEYGEKVPFISNFIAEDTEKTVEEWESDMIGLEAEIKDREVQIDQLKSELQGKDKEIEEALIEIEELQIQIDELKRLQEENNRAFKDIVKTYETMSAKKAAPIITQMNDDQAMKILTSVNADTLAGIMENLGPEDAAKFTELLTIRSED